MLDPLPTTGMAVAPDGTRLARLAWAAGPRDISELLISDHLGLLTYHRLDDVLEAHALLWAGDELHAVSTGSNSVVTMEAAGQTIRPGGRQACPRMATRGLLVTDDLVYVGVTARRLSAPEERARIAVLDRATLREVGTLPLPTRDVFTLCPYVDHLAHGLPIGTTLGVSRRFGSPDVLMDEPLGMTESIVCVTVVETEPSRLTVHVANRGGAILSRVGRFPVESAPDGGMAVLSHGLKWPEPT